MKNAVRLYKRILAPALAMLVLCISLPISAFALLDVQTLALTHTASGHLYDLKSGSSSQVSFQSAIQTTYNVAGDDNTLPAGSSITVTIAGSASEIIGITFPTLSSTASGASVTLSLDGSAEVYKTLPVSEASKTNLPLPAGTTAYKITFTADTKVTTPGYPATPLYTYATVDMTQSATTAPTSTLAVTLPGRTTEEITATFAETDTADKSLVINGSFVPSPAEYSELPESVALQLRLAFRAAAASSGYNQHLAAVLQLSDTSIDLHAANDLYPVSLTIPANALSIGKDGAQGAPSTFDVYIKGQPDPYRTGLSTAEEHIIGFSGTEEMDITLVLADGSMQACTARPAAPLTLICNVNPDTERVNFNSYAEVKTNVGGAVISSMNPDYSNRMDTYFMWKAHLDNVAAAPTYSVGDDIVFTLSNINAAKFVGDFRRVYPFISTNTNLENYYLKGVEITPTILTPTQGEGTLNVKLNSELEGKEEKSIGAYTYPTPSAEIAPVLSYANDDTAYSASSISGSCIWPARQSFHKDLLALGDYAAASIVGGANLTKFSIKLTYGQKPGMPVTQTTTFENTVKLTISPTININDRAAVSATMVGTTKIVVPTPDPVPDPRPDPKPTPTPLPTPSPEPTPTPEPTPSPVPTPDPEPTPAPEPTPTPGPELPPHIVDPGKDPHDPTFPPVYDDVLDRVIPNDDGSYTMIDEEGVPLGTWNWIAEEEIWIFEGETPLGNLPQTGTLPMSANLFTPLLWAKLLLISGAGLMVACLFLWKRKQR